MQELSRICRNRWRIVFFVLCVIINGLYFWQSQDVEEEQEYYNAYRDYIREHEETTPEELQSFVDVWQEEKDARESAGITGADLSLEEIRQERVMMEMAGTIEYLVGYSKRYEEMSARAEKMKKFSIFRQSDSVSYENIEKQVNDFKEASQINVSLTQDKAIRAWETDDLPDYLLILLEIVIVVAFFEERNKGFGTMVRATPGRNRLVIKRIGILAVTAIVGSVILYGTNLYLAIRIYGAPDWNHALQCLPGYGKCPYLLNIREYIILNVWHKAWCIFGIACFFWLIMMLVSGTAGAIVCIAILLCVQYMMYHNIGDLHALAVLKYVNVFSCLHVSQALQIYLNVQVAGKLVEIWNVHRVALPIVTIVLAGMCLLAGCRLRGPLIKKVTILPGRLLTKSGLALGRPSLMLQEGYKYLRVHGSLFLLAGMAVYLYVTFSANNIMYDEVQTYVKEYYQRLEGELTEEKEAYIQEEENRIQNQLEDLEAAYILGKDENIVQYYENIRRRILDEQEAVEEIRMECDRLKELQAGGIQACFVEPYGYRAVFEKSELNNSEKLLLFILVLPLLTAGIFAYENQSNAKGMMTALAAGRNKVYRVKWVWAWIGTVLLWAMLCAREWTQARIQYDFLELDAPIQNLSLFAQTHANISIRTGLILLYTGRLLVMCVITWITGQISKRCHNVRNAYVISIVFLVMPSAFVVVGASYLEKVSFLNILRFGEYMTKWFNMW